MSGKVRFEQIDLSAIPDGRILAKDGDTVVGVELLEYTYVGSTPGSGGGETDICVSSGPSINPLVNDKSYAIELNCIGTVNGLGAAPKQTVNTYYRFTVSVDSAGILDISTGAGFTNTVVGAGLADAFVDTLSGGPNTLNLVWNTGPGTVASSVSVKLRVVAVLSIP